jgi:hypothetical protein
VYADAVLAALDSSPPGCATLVQRQERALRELAVDGGKLTQSLPGAAGMLAEG